MHRYPALDGLRGLAILMVLASHFVAERLAGGEPATAALRALTAFGWAGVDLFFVLSGFLITGLLIEDRESPYFFRTFYARRTIRIFPAYYAALIVTGAVAFAFEVPDASHRLRLAMPYLATYTTNVLLARSNSIATTPFNTAPMWSLAVEEQFYLLWPLVVYFTPPRRLIAVFATCVAAALALRVALAFFANTGLAAAMLMPCRADSLAIGGLLAVARQRDLGDLWLRRLGRAQWTAGAFLLLLVLTGLDGGAWDNHVIATFGLSALAVFFAGAVWDATMTSPSFFRFLGSLPPLRWVGFYAYGIYLWHGLVRVVMGYCGFDDQGLVAKGFSQIPAVLIAAAIGVTASIAVALLSWHLVEGPINRFKDRFPYRAAP